MIPQELLTKLSESLNRLSENTQKLARAELEAIEYSSYADLRNKTLEVLNKYSLASGEIAGGYGAAFFDDVMAENGETREGVIYSFSNTDANNKAVRGMMQDVVAGGSVASFFDAIQNRLDYNIRRTSNQCVLENIKDRSKHLKFARVPTGLETCAFCFMLASRGFVYWSRATAGEFDHYHSNCNCRIVPGFDDVDPDTQVEGYEPSKYYKQFEDCYKAVKDPSGSFDYDLYLKDVAKGKYGTTPDEWQRWKDNRLMNEIRSRDVNWRWTGEPVKYEIMEGAKPNEREKGTAITLGDKGRKVIFKPTKDEEEEKSCDVYDITNGKKKPIEFKCPIGGGKQTIYHQFEEGAGQSENLIIDISNSSLDVEDSYNKCKRFINWTFEIKTGKDKGKQWKYKEVQLISGNDLYSKIER